MRKWRRGVLWTAAALVLLFAAADLTLHMVFSQARLLSLAQGRVERAWGRKLEAGTLRWGLFPYPQLQATHVAIANADWAQERHVLEADAISARLALLPLLSGKVVVRGLDLRGLHVNLEVDASGRHDWDMARNRGKAQDPADLLQRIDLTALRIEDGRVDYVAPGGPARSWEIRSLKANGDAHLRHLSFHAALEREGHPLQLAGRLADLSRLGAADAQTQGDLTLRSGPASVVLRGTLPLSPHARYALHVAVDAPSLQEAFGFFDIRPGLPAALKAEADVQGTGAGITIDKASLQLGAMHATGSGRWLLDDGKSGDKSEGKGDADTGGRNGAQSSAKSRGRPTFDAQLRIDRFDMVQTFLDAGLPPVPPKPADELFHDRPLPWHLLLALAGTQGRADVRIGTLRLRNGVQVDDAAAQLRFDGDDMTVDHFAGKLLGGTAEGDAVFHGRRKAVQLNLRLQGARLGDWFRESGKKIDMTGGAMDIDAKLTTAGDTMKALAAHITGPVNARIGPARILSQKAGHAEFWMNGLFSAREANQIDLDCASLRLPFHDGVARGQGIAGARSEASQLLTAGTVDMRREEVDLHGRLRARSGVSVGIATFAGDIRIDGKIAKPQVGLDKAGMGGALARIGAAIVTSGLSIIATSIWDGANPASDACQVVFSARARNARDGAH